jgi:hypothetical protein
MIARKNRDSLIASLDKDAPQSLDVRGTRKYERVKGLIVPPDIRVTNRRMILETIKTPDFLPDSSRYSFGITRRGMYIADSY